MNICLRESVQISGHKLLLSENSELVDSFSVRLSRVWVVFFNVSHIFLEYVLAISFLFRLPLNSIFIFPLLELTDLAATIQLEKKDSNKGDDDSKNYIFLH